MRAVPPSDDPGAGLACRQIAGFADMRFVLLDPLAGCLRRKLALTLVR
jgi:hypothetical protein